jgi:hypothetical protein
MPPAQMEPAQMEPVQIVPAQMVPAGRRSPPRQSPRLHISAKGVLPARSRRPTLIAWRLPSSFPTTS